MVRIGIVGAKNSGKTTLLEQLIPLLIAKGLVVTSVKHTAHQHSFDTPGKDSFRHRQAGSSQTLAVSSAEIALFGPFDTSLREELEELIMRRSDICLIEGDKQSSHPKILLTRNIDQISSDEVCNVVATYGPEKTDRPVVHLQLNEIEQVAEFTLKAIAFSNNEGSNRG